MASSPFKIKSLPPSIFSLPNNQPIKHPVVTTNFRYYHGVFRKFGKVRVLSGGGSSNNDSYSYLDMWKKAVDREKEEAEFMKLVENSSRFDEGGSDDDDDGDDKEVLERRSNEFQKILEVSTEERDRVQRMQVVDRAAAAIAAAKAILKEGESVLSKGSLGKDDQLAKDQQEGGMQSNTVFVSDVRTSSNITPGPDFWTWTPPTKIDTSSKDAKTLKKSSVSNFFPNPVIEKERTLDALSIPFETNLSKTNAQPPLPPLQSLVEVEKTGHNETSSLENELEFGVQFSAHAAEAAHVLEELEKASSFGEYPDGSRWWKETGVEKRPDGVVCKWTLIRGVSADEVVEWEDKYWEAADDFDYKELGSEKSGRDANGNVWREYWKESMWQDCGIMHIEKTADKWGQNGKGDEWREKWWEQYNASGKAEKWADKWSSIDPTTQLEAGHAHVWHERWGEKYDGRGASIKYTDKWAERSEGDGWSKWGDKWDENFDTDGHGVKQGETWWEGKYGERWNRTWGEGHNGSGWVHKYGKSSSGEHWDTHEEQETWYEKYPHFGFMHCLENSGQLRDVQKPSTDSE